MTTFDNVIVKSEPEYKPAKKQRPQQLDEDMSRELELWVMNTGELYNATVEVAQHFLAKLHLKFGYIGKERAISYIKGFVVESTIKDYRTHNDLPRVNDATKEHLANRLFEIFIEGISYILQNEDPKEIKKWRAYNEPDYVMMAKAGFRT